jgi:Protein of unknown function (DUF3467)
MDHERKSGQTSNPLEGRYVNYFKIGYNAFELIIDCGQCYADNEEPQLYTRIVMSPAYGKVLLKTLHDSLEEYEKAYGRVGE